MIVYAHATGLKWSGLKRLLFEAAIDCGVRLDILSEDRGLLRHTLYFSLDGNEGDIRRAQRGILAAVREYNQ